MAGHGRTGRLCGSCDLCLLTQIRHLTTGEIVYQREAVGSQECLQGGGDRWMQGEKKSVTWCMKDIIRGWGRC